MQRTFNPCARIFTNTNLLSVFQRFQGTCIRIRLGVINLRHRGEVYMLQGPLTQNVFVLPHNKANTESFQLRRKALWVLHIHQCIQTIMRRHRHKHGSRQLQMLCRISFVEPLHNVRRHALVFSLPNRNTIFLLPWLDVIVRNFTATRTWPNSFCFGAKRRIDRLNNPGT